MYLGLHVGEVFYGNVGSRERLDFTVIGPAVNEASRIAAMCRSVDQPILMSAAFADVGDIRRRLVSVGRYALRGVPASAGTVHPRSRCVDRACRLAERPHSAGQNFCGLARLAGIMEMSLDLLGNAMVSGLLLGGFYAAVTIGVSISFGMLDIVNIAHPAFIMLGLLHRLYRQHDAWGRSDPGERHRAAGVLPAGRGGLSGLLRRLRTARRRGAARPRLLLRPAVHHRGHARAGVRRRLPAGRGAVYRAEPASRHCRSAVAAAGARAWSRWS